jgi:hypothetical protein
MAVPISASLIGSVPMRSRIALIEVSGVVIG